MADDEMHAGPFRRWGSGGNHDTMRLRVRLREMGALGFSVGWEPTIFQIAPKAWAGLGFWWGGSPPFYE